MEKRKRAEQTSFNEVKPSAKGGSEYPYWSSLISKIVAGLLTGAMSMSLAAKAEAFAAQQAESKDSGEISQSEYKTFQEKVRAAERLYQTPFENSTEQVRKVYTLLEDITHSAEFGQLDRIVRAELLHREGYAKSVFNYRYLVENFEGLSKEDIEGITQNYEEVRDILHSAVTVEGRVSTERERTIRALVQAGRQEAFMAIRVIAERPELKREAAVMRDRSCLSAELALSLDPRTRYAGNGMFLFSKDNKREAVSKIVGLAKFAGDLPAIMSSEEAVGVIGGANYSVSKDVVPWANAVRSGKFPSSLEEKAFIDSLVQNKVLVEQGKDLLVGQVNTLTLTTPDETFVHEVAHEVEGSNPEKYLGIAQRNFASMSVQDQKLFNDFMRVQNPKLTQRDKMEEYFAYTNESRPWKEHARQVLRNR